MFKIILRTSSWRFQGEDHGRFQGEDHGDLDNISYPRFVRDEWGFEGIIFCNYRDIGWEKSGFVIMSFLSCFQSTHV